MRQLSGTGFSLPKLNSTAGLKLGGPSGRKSRRAGAVALDATGVRGSRYLPETLQLCIANAKNAIARATRQQATV